RFTPPNPTSWRSRCSKVLSEHSVITRWLNRPGFCRYRMTAFGPIAVACGLHLSTCSSLVAEHRTDKCRKYAPLINKAATALEWTALQRVTDSSACGTAPLLASCCFAAAESHRGLATQATLNRFTSCCCCS